MVPLGGSSLHVFGHLNINLWRTIELNTVYECFWFIVRTKLRKKIPGLHSHSIQPETQTVEKI